MTTAVEDRISVEDRVSRLEGAYEHLATKVDLSELRAEFKEDMGKLHASLVKWMVGVMLGGVGAMVGAALLIQRLSG